MDNLPQEVYDNIATWLPLPCVHRSASTPEWTSVRPAIATVSKKFQLAVERLTFRTISTSSDEIEIFHKIFESQKRRRNFLSDLRFVVLLPVDKRLLLEEYETELERQGNNRSAAKELKVFLNYLSRWDAEQRVRLQIRFASFEDTDGNSLEDLDSIRQRYLYSYITLDEMEHMPSAPCVEGVQINTISLDRRLTPTSALALATKFPRADKLHVGWYEPYGFKWFRLTMRHDLIRSLKSFCRPSTLRTLVLEIGSPSLDIAEDPPLLATEDGGTTDALGSAIHHALARFGNLEHLIFHGEVDGTFFWPYSFGQPEPFWQSLKTLELTMDITLPCGDLYFRDEFYNLCVKASKKPYVTHKLPEKPGSLPPGYGNKIKSSESAERLSEMEGRQREIQFYAIPNGYNDELGSEDEEAIAPKIHKLSMVNRPAMTALLEAIIKAMGQMQSLECLRLGGVRQDFWAMEFNAPGIQSPLDRFVDTRMYDEPLAHARIYMRSVIWTPDDTTLDKFREMAKHKYGRKAIISFIDRKQMSHRP